MLNTYTSGQHSLRAELELRYWQLVLQLTRVAAGAHAWGQIFFENRYFMALAFMSGILMGLISVIK
jgi:hypothetical protein